MEELPFENEIIADGMLPLDIEIPGQGTLALDSLINSLNSQNANNSQENDLQGLYQVLDTASQEVLFANNIQQFTPEFLSEIADKILSPSALDELRQLLADISEINTQEKIEIIKKLALFLSRQQEIVELFESRIQLSLPLQDEIDPVSIQCVTELLDKNMGNVENIKPYLQQIVGLFSSFNAEGVKDECFELLQLAIKEHGYILDVKEIETLLVRSKNIQDSNYVKISDILLLFYLNQIEEGEYLRKEQIDIWAKVFVQQLEHDFDNKYYLIKILDHVLEQETSEDIVGKNALKKLYQIGRKSSAGDSKNDIECIIAIFAIKEVICSKPANTELETIFFQFVSASIKKYFRPLEELLVQWSNGDISRETTQDLFVKLNLYSDKIINNSKVIESSTFNELNCNILNKILPVSEHFSDANSIAILYKFIKSLIDAECVTLIEPIKAKISDFVESTLIKAKKLDIIKNGVAILKAIDRSSELVRAHGLLSEFALANSDSETSELELKEKINELKSLAMNGVVAGEYILSEAVKGLLKDYDGSQLIINNIIELLTLLIKDQKLTSATLQLIAKHIDQYHKEDASTKALFKKLRDNNKRYFASADSSISDITEETLSETDISESDLAARDAYSRVEANNNSELDSSSSFKSDMDYWNSDDDMERTGSELLGGINNSDASLINPEKQYKGRLTIDVIDELFHNDRVEDNESNFQEEKPLYIAFNLGGKSDISAAGQRGESVEGSHWVAMCVIRQGNCLKVLYKDSYGNARYAEQMNVIRDEFIKQGEEAGLRVEFISHNSKDQEDGSACGPMTLRNLEIMAKHIESNGEQSLIDQYQSLEFSKQSNVQTIRNEHAALSSVASSVEVVNVDLEKTEQILKSPGATTEKKLASQSQINDKIEDATPAVAQKDLQQIFAELIANNAEDLTEDRLNLLKTGYRKIIEAYNNKSAILPSSGSQSAEAICNWTKSTILEFAKYFKDTYLKDKEAVDPASYQYELLAVIKKANILSSGNDPRDVQILSLLLMLQSKAKGTLLQVATGEGKSTIVAMLAAFKAMNGQVVDIITSSPKLAERDSKDPQKQQFYNMLGLKATHNNSDTTHSRPRACYKSDIVYGDINSFQSDALRDREYNVRNNRPYEVVIADEVDSMLIDQRAKLVMLSNGIPGASMCSPLYCALVNKLHDVNAHIAPIDADDLSKGYRYIDGDFTKDADNKIVPLEGVDSYRVDDLDEFIPNHLRDFFNQLLAGNKLDLPGFLLEEYSTPSKIDELIRSLLRSISMSLDKDYTNAVNKYGKSTPTPVDANNTGIIQKNTSLKHGLQQFLEAKEGAALTSESSTTQYISNMGYFKKYMNYNTYGLTGTLGSKLESDLLRAIYEVETHDVPTFKEKQFEQYETTITNSEAEQQAAIIKAIKREIEEKGRAVLVICQTIKQAQDLYKAAKSFRQESSIKLYARSDVGDESQLPQCMFTGSLIIATNLAGRGTDIKTSKLLEAAGGLHVIIGFLPANERVEQQAFGRTSRCGNHGSGELIIIDEQAAKVIGCSKSELNHVLASCDRESNNTELLKVIRAAVEQKTVEDAKLYDVNRITLEDRLYDAYIDLLFSLKAAENDKAKLSQLEEDWGRALKAIKKDYKDAINEQKASYQGDITTAEAAERICKVAEEKAWKEFNKFKEKKQQEYNNPADKYAMIRNPYYLVVAAINKMGDGGDSYKRAMEMLDKALGLETEYRYPMLYHKAYALIRDNAEYCAKKGKARTDNIQEVFDYLQDAKANILEYAIPNIEMVALFNIKIGDNDLFLQTQDKIKLLKLYIEHIDKVCAKLASISQGKYIDIKDIKLLKDFYDDKDRPLAEIHDLNQLGMIQIFDVKEVKPPVDYFSAIAVGVLGVIQMALGVMAVCAGQFSFGLGLFSSGVGDISKAFAIAGGAEFSWKDYVTEKAVTAAIIVVTMGVEVGLEKLGVAGFVGAPTPEKLSVGAALTELAIGTAAILAVDKGFSLLEQKQAKNIEKEFRDDIEKEVEKKVGNCFAKDHVKEQLALLLAIDKLNGNHDNYNAIKSLSDKAVKQKQNALQSVVGSVLSKIASKASEAKGASMASVVLKGADLTYKAFNIGDCLDKISTITKKICGNIEAQINHMAASQTARLDLVNYLTSRMRGDITEDQAANIKAELESNNLLVNGKLQENAEEFAIEEDLDFATIIRIQALLKEHRKINNSYEKEQEELKQIIENTIKKGISNKIIGGVLQPVVGELTQVVRSALQEKLVDLQRDVISGKTRTLKDVISGKNRTLTLNQSYQESIKNKEAVMRQIAGDILQERNEQFVAELTEASNASIPQDVEPQSKINNAQGGITTYASTGQEGETTQSPIGPTTLSNASLYFSTGAPNTSSGKVYNSYVSDDSASSDRLLPLYDVAREYKIGEVNIQTAE